MGAWAGVGFGRRGLRVGQAFGVLLLGLGLAAPAQGFLGIKPPYATEVLNDKYCSRSSLLISILFSGTLVLLVMDKEE